MLPENAKKFRAQIEEAERGSESAIRFLRNLIRNVADGAPAEELILICRFLYIEQTGSRN